MKSSLRSELSTRSSCLSPCLFLGLHVAGQITVCTGDVQKIVLSWSRSASTESSSRRSGGVKSLVVQEAFNDH